MKQLLLGCLIVALAPAVSLADEPATPTAGALYEKVLALDAAMFDSFNKCTDPAELEKHATFLVKELEAYHDNGGVTWTRDAYMKAVHDNVCGKFHRELDVASFRVWPIKGFGAIAQGTHRFCHTATTCEGAGQFTMIWREKDGVWQVTRVLSYDHRPESRPAAGRPQQPLPYYCSFAGGVARAKTTARSSLNWRFESASITATDFSSVSSLRASWALVSNIARSRTNALTM